MTSRIECFWMVPTTSVQRSLRRYVFNKAENGLEKCSSRYEYHNASNLLDVMEVPLDQLLICGDGTPNETSPWVAHDHLSWPIHCECGYEFKASDEWQVNLDRLYEGTKGRFTIDGMPPGAMYDAEWYKIEAGYGVGSDGVALCVKLPPGREWDVWHVDGIGKASSRWDRVGTIPKITATPSILTPDYHGFLRDGWLEEC